MHALAIRIFPRILLVIVCAGLLSACPTIVPGTGYFIDQSNAAYPLPNGVKGYDYRKIEPKDIDKLFQTGLINKETLKAISNRHFIDPTKGAVYQRYNECYLVKKVNPDNPSDKYHSMSFHHLKNALYIVSIAGVDAPECRSKKTTPLYFLAHASGTEIDFFSNETSFEKWVKGFSWWDKLMYSHEVIDNAYLARNLKTVTAYYEAMLDSGAFEFEKKNDN